MFIHTYVHSTLTNLLNLPTEYSTYSALCTCITYISLVILLNRLEPLLEFDCYFGTSSHESSY